MPIKYDELMALKNLGQKYAYGDREVMLYAYGIGMGADPMDENELAFVNEAAASPRPLKVVPTFVSVAAWGAGPGEMNLNRMMVVDGERDITFHKPLSTTAHITADSSVLAVTAALAGRPKASPSRIRCRPAVRTKPSISRRGRTRRWSTGSAAIAIRCTPIRNSQNAPVFQDRSCTACAPTASPAAACCRPMPTTTLQLSSSTRRGFPRPSIPARP